jgi:hypothetical protein
MPGMAKECNEPDGVAKNRLNGAIPFARHGADLPFAIGRFQFINLHG